MTDPALDLALMRATMQLESDPAAALRQAGDILARAPGHAEASLLLAAASRRLGQTATATDVLEALARAQPASAVMQLELGRAYAAAGRRNDALISLRHSVELDAGLADGWRELAAQHFLAEQIPEGDAAYGQYLELAPDPPELTDAKVALAENRVAAAEILLRQRLRAAPDDAVAHKLLADAASRRGDRAAAEACLVDSLAHAPGYAPARYELARVLYGEERLDEASIHVERLLTTQPQDPHYRSLKSQILRLQGRIDESMALMERTLDAYPDDADLWLILGNLLRETGASSRTVEAYRRALALKPGCGEAYWGLANLKTYRFSAEDRDAMQRWLLRALPYSTDRVHLEFALGKAFEDERQYSAAFEHYARGNTLKRAMIDYDTADTTAFVHRSTVLYSTQFFRQRTAWGSESNAPIFIVGLPRSGSTLLEQILASHSAVEGTRELPDLPALVTELMTVKDYPELVASLDEAAIVALGARYLERTASRRPMGRPRFVDKMLGNFSHVGLIHLMFPNAAIIDARRHPMGCGFSCYKQLFSRGMNFSYDLRELGGYYREYAALMACIDAVLPGRVHRVHYEELVADPEREVRRLLDYCGLPFEASCLRFHENRRVVQTVSSEQVRLPLYADAVGQWRHFEPWLAPLSEALGLPAEGDPKGIAADLSK